MLAIQHHRNAHPLSLLDTVCAAVTSMGVRRLRPGIHLDLPAVELLPHDVHGA